MRYRSGQLVLVPLTKEQVIAQKNVVTYSVFAGTLIYVAGPSVLQAGSYIAVTTLYKVQQLGQSISVGGGPVPALAGVGAFDTAVAAESAVSIPLIGQGAATLADAETFALLMDGMGSGGKDSGNGVANNTLDSLNKLPSNAIEMYKKYEKSGWRGTVEGQTYGTSAGGKYLNRDSKLPIVDNEGNPLTYREFDVNNKLPNANRDAQRFIVGSDGSIYYTDNHYLTFTKIK